jgi:hypothetical protein
MNNLELFIKMIRKIFQGITLPGISEIRISDSRPHCEKSRKIERYLFSENEIVKKKRKKVLQNWRAVQNRHDA